jgi:hypothetical protein
VPRAAGDVDDPAAVEVEHLAGGVDERQHETAGEVLAICAGVHKPSVHELGRGLSAELLEQRSIGVAVAEALGCFRTADAALRGVLPGDGRAPVTLAVGRYDAGEETGARGATSG